MSKRIVIVSGGKLEESVCLPILEGQKEGYIIGVDRGLEFLYQHQIMPDYIVGDFDSVKKEVVDYYREETHAGIREYNPVKDASDTEIAIRLAMTLGGTDLVILGATGGRIDHLWANVQSLAIPFKACMPRSWTVRTGSFFWERGKPILRRVRHMGHTFRFFRWEMKCLVSRSKERNIRCMIMC